MKQFFLPEKKSPLLAMGCRLFQKEVSLSEMNNQIIKIED